MHNLNGSLKKNGFLNKTWKTHKPCAVFFQRRSPEPCWYIQCIKISGIRQLSWRWSPNNYCDFFRFFIFIQFFWSIQTQNILSLFSSLEMSKECTHSSFSSHFAILGVINSPSSSFSLFLKRNGIWIGRGTGGRLTPSSDVCSAQRQLVP